MGAWIVGGKARLARGGGLLRRHASAHALVLVSAAVVAGVCWLGAGAVRGGRLATGPQARPALSPGHPSLEAAWFEEAVGARRCDFSAAAQEQAVLRRMREQRLRDSLAQRGHADKVEHAARQDVVAPLADLPDSAYRFPAEARVRYACEGLSAVAQGSFRVEAVLALLAHLTSVQVAHGVTGAIGEVGVHHGLFFVGLAHLAQQGEGLYAADVFEDQNLNVDGSGFGDRAAFMRATGSNGISEADMTVVAGSTADLDDLGGMAFRMFSVDAGHTRELTYNDMSLAACHLAKGGIIILDDVPNMSAWPGVVDGFFSWLHYFPVDFAPFFVGYNKVLICHRDWHRTYYGALVRWIDTVPASKLGLTGQSLTNDNPHKAPTSGTNELFWSGYRFVTGNNAYDIRAATDTWVKEISSDRASCQA